MSAKAKAADHPTLWEFDCHHELTFTHSPPKVGDVLWCRYCVAERVVTRKIPRSDQIKVNCLDCRYARNYGAAELTAKTMATKHAFKHPGHDVEVRDATGRLILKAAIDPRTETELPGF